VPKRGGGGVVGVVGDEDIVGGGLCEGEITSKRWHTRWLGVGGICDEGGLSLQSTDNKAALGGKHGPALVCACMIGGLGGVGGHLALPKAGGSAVGVQQYFAGGGGGGREGKGGWDMVGDIGPGVGGGKG
jgi:hypothetical protein